MNKFQSNSKMLYKEVKYGFPNQVTPVSRRLNERSYSRKLIPEKLIKKEVIPEITQAGNGIILKLVRIILPGSLQQTARLDLSRKPSKPKRFRAAAMIFFQKIAAEFFNKCLDCVMFTNKKITEPLQSHTKSLNKLGNSSY